MDFLNKPMYLIDLNLVTKYTKVSKFRDAYFNSTKCVNFLYFIRSCLYRSSPFDVNLNKYY